MALIAHYPLNGDTKDYSGYGKHGSTTSVEWADGKTGLSAKLAGASDRVSIPTPPIGEYFSVALWHYSDPEVGSSSWRTLIGATGNIHPLIFSGRVSLGVFDGGFKSFNYTIPINVWIHISVVYDILGKSANLYINGVFESSINITYNSTNNPINAIGGSAGFSYSSGYINEVRIYDHALSPREVRDLSLGMVGNYPLRSDAINAGGYNSGILNGSVVFSEEMGGSAEFNNSSYIQLETGITGDPDELSASFWAKTDALQTYDGLIQFDGVSGGHNEGFVISVANSTSMRLRYWTDGGNDTTWPAGGFSSGKESHFCVTLKDNLFTLYQDGEKVGERTYSNPFKLNGGVKLGLYTYSNSYFTGWIKDARIYATALTATQVKELYQTRASIDNMGNLHVYESDEVSGDTSGITSHGIAKFTSINEVGRPVRYIRDWLNGSTSNASNHWVEIQAIDPSGTNVAIGKSSPSELITDGSTASNPYYSGGSGLSSVTVDLGAAHNITYLHIWHYWSGGRTYHNTKTEVSTDGTSWVTVFDSAVEGEYAESSEGKKILLYPDKVSIGSDGDIYTNEILEN